MNKIRTIFFDFDGVLGRGRFYTGEFKENNQDVYQWIQENIFGNKEIILKWEKGLMSYLEINKIISKNTGLEQKVIDEALIESAKNKIVDGRVLREAGNLKKDGYKLGIISDNMDVFSKFTVKENKLKNIFDLVVNSADYGFLKDDFGGKLFDIALEAIGETNIKKSLLVDDSKDTVEIYKNKGGQAFHYQNFEDFKIFINSIKQ